MKEHARFVSPSVILTLPMLCHSRAYFRRIRHDGEIREDPLNEPCNIAPRNARILKHKLCEPRARCVRKRDAFRYRVYSALCSPAFARNTTRNLRLSRKAIKIRQSCSHGTRYPDVKVFSTIFATKRDLIACNLIQHSEPKINVSFTYETRENS